MSEDTEAPNEIVAAAREQAAQQKRLKQALPIAVGVGSAALVAALLYARRRDRDDD